MAYSIQLLYTSVPALIALKHSMFLSYARPSTTIIIRGGVEDIRLEAKDSPSEDRPSRDQDQGHRRKNSQKKNLQKKFSDDLKKQKRSSNKFFRRTPKKRCSKIFFPAIYKILTIQKTVLSSSRGQGNFRGLEASRPRT